MFLNLLLLIFNFGSSAIPTLDSWVNDYANVIRDETKYEIEAVLKNYQEKTGNQIFVLTVASIGEYPSIEDYSLAVAETWKAGTKGVDNGIIIVVAVNDRLTRIEVGYGLEGKLPDAIAGRIVRGSMLPYFKNSDYDSGIKSAVSSIIEYIGTQKLSNSKSKGKDSLGLIIMLLLFLSGRFFFFPFFGFPFSGRGGFGGSGGFGGGGGGGFGGGGSSGSW